MARPVTLRWILSCGETLVCSCRHWVGQRVYCFIHGDYHAIVNWEEYQPSGGDERESDDSDK